MTTIKHPNSIPYTFPTAKELAHIALSEAGWVELTPWLCGPGPKALQRRPEIVSWHFRWDSRDAAADGYDLSLLGAGALAQARYIVHLSVCPRHPICPFLTAEWPGNDEATQEFCRQANYERYHNPPLFEEVLDHYWYCRDMKKKGQT